MSWGQVKVRVRFGLGCTRGRKMDGKWTGVNASPHRDRHQLKHRQNICVRQTQTCRSQNKLLSVLINQQPSIKPQLLNNSLMTCTCSVMQTRHIDVAPIYELHYIGPHEIISKMEMENEKQGFGFICAGSAKLLLPSCKKMLQDTVTDKCCI